MDIQVAIFRNSLKKGRCFQDILGMWLDEPIRLKRSIVIAEVDFPLRKVFSAGLLLFQWKILSGIDIIDSRSSSFIGNPADKDPRG